MLSTVLEAVRSRRTARLAEILRSIRWMHRRHVKALQGLGYSPKEAFWLNFACLPFLPWDAGARRAMPLSMILNLYVDLYRSTVGPLAPEGAEAFSELLRRRYQTIRQVAAASDAPCADEADADSPGQGLPKWALAGIIVFRTARAWQGHGTTFPCRLAEDI